MTASKSVLAFHFLNGNKVLAHSDKRRVCLRKTLKCDKHKLELCRYGLHASIRVQDAFSYCQQPILCRVKLGGEIIEGKDKLVASERTVLWWVNLYDKQFELLQTILQLAMPRINKIEAEICKLGRAEQFAKDIQLITRLKALNERLETAGCQAWSNRCRLAATYYFYSAVDKYNNDFSHERFAPIPPTNKLIKDRYDVLRNKVLNLREFFGKFVRVASIKITKFTGELLHCCEASYHSGNLCSTIVSGLKKCCDRWDEKFGVVPAKKKGTKRCAKR